MKTEIELPDFDFQHDSVLLKIHRDFSKDEAVKVLEAQIRSLEKENAFLKTQNAKDLTIKALNYDVGVLKSENAELKYLLNCLSSKPAILKNTEEYSEDMKKVVAFYTKQTTALKKAIRQAMKNATDWQEKYFSVYLRK